MYEIELNLRLIEKMHKMGWEHLKSENEYLKSENERLLSENERLLSENEHLLSNYQHEVSFNKFVLFSIIMTHIVAGIAVLIIILY